jgi:hypothetical protein
MADPTHNADIVAELCTVMSQLVSYLHATQMGEPAHHHADAATESLHNMTNILINDVGTSLDILVYC